MPPDKVQNIKIIHFDDEPNSVLTIPNSLFNLYVLQMSNWVDDEDCVYAKFVKSFAIKPPGCPRVQVTYMLEDEEECRVAIESADPKTDIAVLDLTRFTDEGPDASGKRLYELAMKRGFDTTRVFVLTGFPTLLPKEGMDVPKDQTVLKPVSSTEFAKRLMELFPEHARIPA